MGKGSNLTGRSPRFKVKLQAYLPPTTTRAGQGTMVTRPGHALTTEDTMMEQDCTAIGGMTLNVASLCGARRGIPESLNQLAVRRGSDPCQCDL